MPTTLLPPPPPESRAGHGGPSDRDGSETRVTDNAGRRGRRAPLAVLLTGVALLGGAASTGVLALAGLVGAPGATSATTVVRSASSGKSGGSSGLDARAISVAASAGNVDIRATGTTSRQAGPFGQGSSQSTATGSGFVVDAKGHIVTAAHVVEGAASIKVTFSDGSTRSASLVGKDQATDVAVLKVDPSGLTLHPLTLGRSASLAPGDALAAIGSPFGYQESISTGIVSGVDRTIDAPNGYTVAHAIQTDAALNPGNSGGPILDARGRVVGIADQIATGGSSDQGSGVGFAIPIDLLAGELVKLEAGETVRHASLGVGTTGSTARVASVKPGGAAASAGLKAGDVVTAIDGKKIGGSGDLVAAIADRAPGDRVTLSVRRGSETLRLTAKLGTQPTTPSSGSAG